MLMSNRTLLVLIISSIVLVPLSEYAAAQEHSGFTLPPQQEEMAQPSEIGKLMTILAEDVVADARAFAGQGMAQGPLFLDATSFTTELRGETKAPVLPDVLLETVATSGTLDANVQDATYEVATEEVPGGKGPAVKIAENGIYLKLVEASKTNRGLELVVRWFITGQHSPEGSALGGKKVKYYFVREAGEWRIMGKEVISVA